MMAIFQQRRVTRRTGVLLCLVAAVLGGGLADRAEATWSIIIIDTQSREIAVGSATCLTGFGLLKDLPVRVVAIGGAAASASVAVMDCCSAM